MRLDMIGNRLEKGIAGWRETTVEIRDNFMPLLVNENGWSSLFSDVDFRGCISDLTVSGHEDRGGMYFFLSTTATILLYCSNDT